jgi:hypothetical protein
VGLGAPLESTSGAFASSGAGVTDLSTLNITWYLNWTVYPSVPNSTIDFIPMVRTGASGLIPAPDDLREAVRGRPGATWIIGNEPDNVYQDNLPPEQFAAQYHEAYTLIKQADPTARVAVGGITLSSPLRLAYLDVVLTHYRARFGMALPADLWTVHHYWLPEYEDGSWIGVPPGLPAQRGVMADIDDHASVERFIESLRRFRAWMAERGYRDRPLLLTEFGGAVPGMNPNELLGFMRGAVGWMAGATDRTIGYAADGNRLVQGWAWFSLRYPPLPVSDLITAEASLTPLGELYRELARRP